MPVSHPRSSKRTCGATASGSQTGFIARHTAALYSPRAFDIGVPGDIHKASLVEMSIGVAIGAVTFTGLVIAFLKLDGRMSGKPILLPIRHVINIALGVLLVLLIV
jgi:NAD(P) transhydrogenase subunit beta